MIRGVEVRALRPEDVDWCSEILYALPEWFGIEEANRAYVESLGQLPGAVALRDDRIVGFVALAEHTPHSIEVHVLAVDRTCHRSGAGKALVDWAESWCRARGARWLHVKTRGPSTPDHDYEKTRAFYRAVGFETLFETQDLWGPQDAALILVKRLGD